jgi:putative cell wall binding repeat protein
MVRRRLGGGAARLALAGLLVLVAGCGGSPRTLNTPEIGQSGTTPQAPEQLGFPAFATKNTTRVGGADAVADAAGAALAVYPSAAPGTHPPAVVLADQRDWRAPLAAAVLMSAPLRAPLLLSDGAALPQASADALRALAPAGAPELSGAQVIRIGDAPAPGGYRTTSVAGRDPYALAAAIDHLASVAAGTPSRDVVVASADVPAYAMPAAAWAAKSGDPILFVHRNTIPGPTFAALQSHRKPRIFVLGPPTAIGPAVVKALGAIGNVTRVAGSEPVTNAIAFARFADGPFGWGVTAPGHGLVFANARRPLDAAAAAPLSASGTYGPLLLVDDPRTLPLKVGEYLLDVQPGFSREHDPVQGVYNHGWLIGDAGAISVPVQARIDRLLEISPIDTSK